ncbi:TetR family transcriptional regulator [Sediminihabitans luteus]|uniref:TetR family transcriptional regulator n=1 Tax=Sediminihabitans luteus TaxID=1138585 RepID=A0A2M9CZT6_9CELL|nr:TetR/AcrR family transcriptional regulator [Sediminihabitans luteus]PJJ77456.1 TetR family transcriptional regulator [Sediminihabitans luteus]GII98349.1 TetR family transcriptional regulator [Sediminihabitans luteus]
MADRAAVVRRLGELFRERGYATSSLADVTAATGLGRGSLYHLFPDGKPQMLAAVLDDVDAWFEREVFAPLRDDGDGIERMVDAVDAYFRSGGRLCLVGRVALEPVDDVLARRLAAWFDRWRVALDVALRARGATADDAADLAEETLAAVQGGLVLAHATGDPAVFGRALRRVVGRYPRRPSRSSRIPAPPAAATSPAAPPTT